jgi:hypothetical protein
VRKTTENKVSAVRVSIDCDLFFLDAIMISKETSFAEIVFGKIYRGILLGRNPHQSSVGGAPNYRLPVVHVRPAHE